jgi:excisionase family DNA binding protein
MGSYLRIPKLCQNCDTKFIAKRATTKFCSKPCADADNKARKRSLGIKNVEEIASTKKPQQTPSPIIYHKEILSLIEAAEYMGIGKTTAYRYCVENRLKCVKINRRIFIRRQDIHAVFDTAEDYEVAKQQPRKPITEFYTAREIAEKYNCSKDAVHRYCQSKRVPAIKRGQYYYYSQEHVDRLYSLRKPDPEIASWYSVEDIMEKYTVTKSAVYSLASENAIPKKNNNGRILYSQQHVDALLSQRNIGKIDKDQWYTVPEIVAKYDKPRGWVANFVYKKGITKTKRGTVGYYLKEEFDNEYRKMFPPQEWYSVEEIIEKYNLTQDSVYAFIKRYSIPTEKDGSRLRISKNHIDKFFDYSFI